MSREQREVGVCIPGGRFSPSGTLSLGRARLIFAAKANVIRAAGGPAASLHSASCGTLVPLCRLLQGNRRRFVP